MEFELQNFWNNTSVIDFLDLFTYVDISSEIVARQLLNSIPTEEWDLLVDFPPADLTVYFPFYSVSIPSLFLE